MRARLACLGFAAVAPLVGCRSGAIEVLSVSADGQMLIFRDVFHGTNYAADGEGVRPVRIPKGDYYYLAPDKAWLISTRRNVPRTVEESLEPRREWITAFNLQTGEQFEAEFPFELPQVERTYHTEAAPMYFSDEPAILLGPPDYALARQEPPIKSDRSGWHWRPRETGKTWTGLNRDQAAAVRSRTITIDWGPKLRLLSEHCIVQIPNDGWTAKRCIWVRPDGSTLELSRKNDTVFWCLAGSGMSFALPFFLVQDRGSRSATNHFGTSVAQWASQTWFTWAKAFHGTKADPAGAAAALAELEEMVAARKSAAADASATRESAVRRSGQHGP